MTNVIKKIAHGNQMYIVAGGGSAGDGMETVYLTQSQYDSLTPEEKADTTKQYAIISSTSGSLDADVVNYDNTTSGATATDVQGALDEVFQSVSNGKELIADAITDKGVSTSATDSFQTMASNIENSLGSVYSNIRLPQTMQLALINTAEEQTSDISQREYSVTNSKYIIFRQGNDYIETFIKTSHVNPTFAHRSFNRNIMRENTVLIKNGNAKYVFVHEDHDGSGNTRYFTLNEYDSDNTLTVVFSGTYSRNNRQEGIDEYTQKFNNQISLLENDGWIQQTTSELHTINANSGSGIPSGKTAYIITL